jgi:hypothetical protein
MDPKQLSLLAAKLIVIQKLVAKQHGMGDLTDLSPGEYQRVSEMTTAHLEVWQELESEGHPGIQSDEPFNSLAREYFAIKKMIEG